MARQIGLGEPINDPESLQASAMFGSLSGNGAVQSKDPRKENFWDMWKFTFCPNFSAKSLPVIVAILCLGGYIFSLVMTKTTNLPFNSNVLLGPDVGILARYGARDPYKIVNDYEVWRLVTPLFLTVGFSSFFTSLVALLIIGFMLEPA